MTVRTGQGGDELIGHYEEDVGTVGHGLKLTGERVKERLTGISLRRRPSVQTAPAHK